MVNRSCIYEQLAFMLAFDLRNKKKTLEPDFQKWLKTQTELTEKDILVDGNLSNEQRTSLLERGREHTRILQEQGI